MKCHKGTKENIFLLHVKILAKYREFYDIPHNSGTSVTSRYDIALAENIGSTELKASKLKNRDGTPAAPGNQQRGTPHTGGLKSKRKDHSVTHSLKSSPPTELQVNKKDELDKGSLKDTPQSKPDVSKKDKSGNNSLGKTKKQKENTIKNGLTESTLKGDDMEGLKVNNKSAYIKKKALKNSLKREVSSGLKVSKKGEYATNSPKESPTDVLKARNKDKSENHSSGKAETSKSEDNTKKDELPGQ
ncbi:hypothetical protein C922_00428 [Plasmodium inui San Antonio 1]|uniref:Uncharacterized protein n=1 Tax=Plasmodium inui San Antonio 1 TaxID=1237626 RepID=W7ALB9_9APIC|nr:hypothetical protein C922_00428 [Plasmodium inui San Antonio 1]EUD69564.1 hypothetical protein C922_00428 [Plasmodium inui San Antonio 1]